MGRPGPFTVMLRNWKKTMFIIPAFSTALYYTYDHTVTLGLMKASCKQVTRLGDERLRNPTGEVRHITVILNPVAGKRKAKKLYAKWVEPLFHLAGIKVSVIETDSPNQACELIKVMSNCDGVAIVGGDGTVHEAINGLMSRPDVTKATRSYPMAIIPVGQFNSIARMIYGDLRYRNYKEFLILTTMGLIESKTEKFDVMKLDKISDVKEEDSKPVFALRDLRYGKYQDNYYKTTGYMIYQDYIKPYWLRLRTRNFKPQIESLSYTKPCIGCSKCYQKHKIKDSQSIEINNNNAPKRWWTGLIGLSKPQTAPLTSDEADEISLSKRDNPECDTWFRVENISSISDIRACMINEKKIRLSISRDGEYEPSEIREVQDVKLKVNPELDAVPDKIDDDSSDENKDKKLEDRNKFLIDRQPMPPKSVEMTTLSGAIRIFTRRKLTYEKTDFIDREQV